MSNNPKDVTKRYTTAPGEVFFDGYHHFLCRVSRRVGDCCGRCALRDMYVCASVNCAKDNRKDGLDVYFTR